MCVNRFLEMRRGGWIPASRYGRQPDVTHGVASTAMIASTNMSSRLTIDDVERIAGLAHLELTAEEKTLFTRQLADVLDYARQVQAIDTSGVPATASVQVDHDVEREDEPHASLALADTLGNAPDGAPDAGLFRVPRVIGG
jgi:aspartyl-tRNA(Asn)/glutamyl-tRNA(Gln) amidotransferase subunit C